MRRMTSGIVQAFVLLSLLALGHARVIQNIGKVVFLRVNDPDAGAKILTILNGADQNTVRFSGTVLRGQTPRSFTQGLVSAATVHSIASKYNKMSLINLAAADYVHSSISSVSDYVHSSITDFYKGKSSASILIQIRSVLKGVDSSLYKLSIIDQAR